ncbi:hypothetical protein B0H13DRAFT_1850546 [Mycena leptocephala]|nr:hypothetical protein B0H13DRAFT_1850546 [Mycena leptocephala]
MAWAKFGCLDLEGMPNNTLSSSCDVSAPRMAKDKEVQRVDDDIHDIVYGLAPAGPPPANRDTALSQVRKRWFGYNPESSSSRKDKYDILSSPDKPTISSTKKSKKRKADRDENDNEPEADDNDSLSDSDIEIVSTKKPSKKRKGSLPAADDDDDTVDIRMSNQTRESCRELDEMEFDRPGNAAKKALVNESAFKAMIKSLKDRGKDYVFSIYMLPPTVVKKELMPTEPSKSCGIYWGVKMDVVTPFGQMTPFPATRLEDPSASAATTGTFAPTDSSDGNNPSPNAGDDLLRQPLPIGVQFVVPQLKPAVLSLQLELPIPRHFGDADAGSVGCSRPIGLNTARASFAFSPEYSQPLAGSFLLPNFSGYQSVRAAFPRWLALALQAARLGWGRTNRACCEGWSRIAPETAWAVKSMGGMDEIGEHGCTLHEGWKSNHRHSMRDDIVGEVMDGECRCRWIYFTSPPRQYGRRGWSGWRRLDPGSYKKMMGLQNHGTFGIGIDESRIKGGDLKAQICFSLKSCPCTERNWFDHAMAVCCVVVLGSMRDVGIVGERSLPLSIGLPLNWGRVPKSLFQQVRIDDLFIKCAGKKSGFEPVRTPNAGSGSRFGQLAEPNRSSSSALAKKEPEPN